MSLKTVEATTLHTKMIDNESTPLVVSDPSTLPAVDFNLNKARRLLYVSHFFAQFSECVWQFALILFLAAISNYQSLILVSSYGLTAGLSVCLFGSAAGRFVDREDRLYAAQWFIWTENVCVLVATLFCYFLLRLHSGNVNDEIFDRAGSYNNEDESDDATWLQKHLYAVPLDFWSVVLLIGIHIFGPLAKILDKGFLVAIERDWVVIMSEAAVAGRKVWLPETNVAMKQIDLTCRVAAPAVAGFVIAAFDTSSTVSGSRGTGADYTSDSNQPQQHGQDLTGAVILVGAVNIASLVVEYICTARIYNLVPSLAVKQAPSGATNLKKNPKDEEEAIDVGDKGSDKFTPSRNSTDTGCGFFQLPQGLRIYLEQPISWSGLGLAMLYLNALTFGALMTAYLVWRGMRLETVGIWRGISSAVGLAGTFVYHESVKRTTLVNTGMWSIIYEFACLSICFASLFVRDFNTSMGMLIAGACASRIGLWVFDIAVTQLMQEFIPDGIRGSVGGTQQSLNAFFSLFSFGLGLVFPDPREFHIYIAAGYGAVGVGAIMYALGVYVRRDEFMTSSEKEARYSM
jgi:iron-regulated transporter 1